MKLYIAYYESYVSLIEGKYNYKKDKFKIKNCTFISNKDVDIDYDDKYSLLKEALKSYKSKVKDVVLCLNTKDVIIKSTEIYKANPKDLDGIMNNEMDEIMSLDYDRYTFSYEVTNEELGDNKENLDVIVAAIANDELEQLINIFKEFKLNLERVDTISTAYSRLLKKIEYDNIMILNVGSYGSIVDIFKDDSLFIHDNIPVKINKSNDYYVYSELVEEIKGLFNYYSSRNYGNNIDTIVLVGESNEDKEILNSFKEQFSSDIISGIENLFDIENDISGNLNKHEISQVCDILGSMCFYENAKDYSRINLLPQKVKNRRKLKKNLKKMTIVALIVLVIMLAPYVVFYKFNSKVQEDINKKETQLDELVLESGDIKKIKKEINSAQEELKIYKVLSNKTIEWKNILESIDKNIPSRANLTNINVYYNAEIAKSQKDNKTSNNQKESSNEKSTTSENSRNSTEEKETPIYDQVPNVIELRGEAENTHYIGQFVYNLNQIYYFKSVELKSITEDKEKGVKNFNIVIVLREGAVDGE